MSEPETFIAPDVDSFEEIREELRKIGIRYDTPKKVGNRFKLIVDIPSDQDYSNNYDRIGRTATATGFGWNKSENAFVKEAA